MNKAIISTIKNKIYNIKRVVIITIIAFISSNHLLNAQNILNNKNNYLNISYFGTFNDPGLKVGYMKSLHNGSSDLGLNNENLNMRKNFISYNIGMYQKTNFHNNYFAQVEYIMRRQKKNGAFLDFSPGIGLSRTFLSSATFEVNDHLVTKVPMAGNIYGLISCSASFGYDLSTVFSMPGQVFVKPSLFFFFPYNKLAYARTSIELGYSIKIK